MPDYMPEFDFEEGTVHGIPQVGDVAFVGQDGGVVAGYGPFACFGDESGGIGSRRRYRDILAYVSDVTVRLSICSLPLTRK